jgi:hypothetical protein
LIEWAAFELMPALVAEVGARAIQRAATDFGQRPSPERRQSLASTEPGIHLVRATVVVSNTPGRTRIAVVGLQNNATAAEMVERRLRRIDGVVTSSASPITGRVLVQYDPSLTNLEEIRSAIETIGQPQRAARSQLRERRALTLVTQ